MLGQPGHILATLRRDAWPRVTISGNLSDMKQRTDLMYEADLAALAPGSVVIEPDGAPWYKRHDGRWEWRTGLCGMTITSATLARAYTVRLVRAGAR